MICANFSGCDKFPIVFMLSNKKIISDFIDIVYKGTLSNLILFCS